MTLDPAFQVDTDPVGSGSKILMKKLKKNTAEKTNFFDQKLLFSYP
jgi:hypothetical protein